MPDHSPAPPPWVLYGPPDYLDVAGLAYGLQTSPRTIRRMLSSGRLPPADLNVSATGGPKGRWWSREKLLAWLDSRPGI